MAPTDGTWLTMPCVSSIGMAWPRRSRHGPISPPSATTTPSTVSVAHPGRDLKATISQSNGNGVETGQMLNTVEKMLQQHRRHPAARVHRRRQERHRPRAACRRPLPSGPGRPASAASAARHDVPPVSPACQRPPRHALRWRRLHRISSRPATGMMPTYGSSHCDRVSVSGSQGHPMPDAPEPIAHLEDKRLGTAPVQSGRHRHRQSRHRSRQCGASRRRIFGQSAAYPSDHLALAPEARTRSMSKPASSSPRQHFRLPTRGVPRGRSACLSVQGPVAPTYPDSEPVRNRQGTRHQPENRASAGPGRRRQSGDAVNRPPQSRTRWYPGQRGGRLVRRSVARPLAR